MLDSYNKEIEDGKDFKDVGNPEMSEGTFKLFVYKDLIIELMDYAKGMVFVEDDLNDLGPNITDFGYIGPTPKGFSVLTLRGKVTYTLEGDFDVDYYLVDKEDLPDPREIVA